MLDKLILQKKFTPTAMRMGILMTGSVDEDGVTVKLSVTEIAGVLGITVSAASRALRELVAAGLVERSCKETKLAQPVQNIYNIYINNNNNYNNNSNPPLKVPPRPSDPPPKPPKPKRAQSPRSVHVPDWISGEVWAEFVKMRDRIRKPMTPYAAELIIKQLAKLGESDANAILEQSIANSWQGVFPLKTPRSQPKPMSSDLDSILKQIEGDL